MKQGTVSILVGVHSPVHSLLVALAWHRLYRTWPRPWELMCIVLHDVGHVSLDYLDDPAQKVRHWRLGARIAGRLFGPKGYDLVAGHCADSGAERSKLYKPDKYSRSLEPSWLQWFCTVVEPKVTLGRSRWEHVRWFRSVVAANIESGEYRDLHHLCLERRAEEIGS